jgi:hypothetical protein
VRGLGASAAGRVAIHPAEILPATTDWRPAVLCARVLLRTATRGSRSPMAAGIRVLPATGLAGRPARRRRQRWRATGLLPFNPRVRTRSHPFDLSSLGQHARSQRERLDHAFRRRVVEQRQLPLRLREGHAGLHRLLVPTGGGCYRRGNCSPVIRQAIRRKDCPDGRAGIGLWAFVALSAATVVLTQLAARAVFRLEV